MTSASFPVFEQRIFIGPCYGLISPVEVLTPRTLERGYIWSRRVFKGVIEFK